jgi:hypothetical protein
LLPGNHDVQGEEGQQQKERQEIIVGIRYVEALEEDSQEIFKEERLGPHHP